MVFQVTGAFEKKIDQEASTSNEDDQINTFYEIEYGQNIFVVKTRAELKLKLNNIVNEDLTETKFDYKAFNEFLSGKSDRFEDKPRNLVVTCRRQTSVDEDELVSGQCDEDFVNEDDSSPIVISQKGMHEKPADSQSVNDDNNKHPVNEYGSGQQGSELANIREEIFVKSLYEEALKAYKPPVSSSVDNSKNDDGTIKILKKPYELFPNDLIIHVRSERGIEIWTKVRGSFSNEYQIPSHLKETKPLLKYDHKLNKLALKNLHQHLEGLITEDDPNDTKDDLCGLSLGKVKFPGIPDAYERRSEMYPTNYPNDRKLHYWGDVGFDDYLYQKILIDRVRKSKNILAEGISMHEILRANEQVDRLNEESMQFPYSKVETNSEEQSTINNSEESSQDASNNQERPRARGYECSICGDSFINEVLLELHQAVYLEDHPHRKRDRPIDSADP